VRVLPCQWIDMCAYIVEWMDEGIEIVFALL